MKILIISDEEWNDFVIGNGVLSNWFTGIGAEFAQIFASPGMPNNKVCKKYFQITDVQMAKSFFSAVKAGGEIHMAESESELNASRVNAQRQGIYGFIKKVSIWCHTPVMMLRDFLWLNGRLDIKALYKFVTDFNPDVVFCPRLITPKLMRIERIVHTMTSAPFVAFTGDNEASLTGYSLSPLYWLRKMYIHCMFKSHVQIYSYYLMHSAEQAEEYRKQYGLDTSTLFKCGSFPDIFKPKPIGNPISLVYAGRLYCNRWKSLVEIGKALQIVNREGTKMILDVYTQDQLTDKQLKALSEDKYIFMKGSVTPKELVQKYRDADIALHVESFDRYYRNVTRVSFSTKIIDLMASSCAILAICWEKHCGYQYLKSNNAAFCCDSYDSILPQLQAIYNNPTLITEYQQKAYICGKQNHNRDIIQKQLLGVFENAIKKNNKPR